MTRQQAVEFLSYNKVEAFFNDCGVCAVVVTVDSECISTLLNRADDVSANCKTVRAPLSADRDFNVRTLRKCGEAIGMVWVRLNARFEALSVDTEALPGYECCGTVWSLLNNLSYPMEAVTILSAESIIAAHKRRVRGRIVAPVHRILQEPDFRFR